MLTPQSRASLVRHNDNNHRSTALPGNFRHRSALLHTTTPHNRPTLQTRTRFTSLPCRRPPFLHRRHSLHRPHGHRPIRRSTSAFPHNRRTTLSRSSLGPFSSAPVRAVKLPLCPYPLHLFSSFFFILQNMQCSALRLLMASFKGRAKINFLTSMERCDGLRHIPLPRLPFCTALSCALTLVLLKPRC